MLASLSSDVYTELRQRNLELQELQRELEFKNLEIQELQSELDKYRSVFQRQLSGACSPTRINTSIDSLPSELTDHFDIQRTRGMGISAEPQSYISLESTKLNKIEKSVRSQALIRKAILENEFMRNLHSSQIQSIINCMESVSFKKDSVIILEGEVGSSVFVFESGILTVSKKGKFLREISKETVLGELAILYNCTRTATVTAKENSILWSIDRQNFQTIMMQSGLLKYKEHLEFLKSVPTFQSMEEERLLKITDILEEVKYNNEEYIIRQGGRGDTFYIISEGQVKVTRTSSNSDNEKFIRVMKKGEWFGEKALINEDVRTANIIANDINGVTCLVLDRESYINLIGVNCLSTSYFDEQDSTVTNLTLQNFDGVEIDHFDSIATLGVGGFGRVELVKLIDDDTKSFAMKRMKKSHITRTRQQEHVMNERTILFQVNCQFIVKLYKTFKDSKYLYMLMEVCLGGELWTILRDRRRFTENTTRFYVASVIEGLGYLHSRGIVYRDLKPENIMIDTTGYIKLTDFGFAKFIKPGSKTWTFCGTPEYVAPEVILNKGHDHAADFWSLGVLVYELLTGIPPFYGNEPMKVYNLILKGIDSANFEKTSRNAQNLIKKLCRDVPSDRIGYGSEGIKVCQKHIWFESFDWDGLINKRFKPPIIPQVTSVVDNSNFDSYPDTESDAEEDNSGWDNKF